MCQMRSLGPAHHHCIQTSSQQGRHKGNCRGDKTCVVAPTTIVLAPLALPSAMSARELLLLPTEALLPVTELLLSRMELLPDTPGKKIKNASKVSALYIYYVKSLCTPQDFCQCDARSRHSLA